MAGVFLSWLLPLPLQAKPLEMELKAEGLYVSNPSTAVLQRMFDDYGYRDYIYMPDWKYPPLFLNALPSDFNRVADKNLRNRLFIQILAPLTMLVNERIILERYQLMMIQKRFCKMKSFCPRIKTSWNVWRKNTMFYAHEGNRPL